MIAGDVLILFKKEKFFLFCKKRKFNISGEKEKRHFII